MLARIYPMLYRWGQRRPWEVLICAVIAFAYARRREDALELAVGRHGMAGLGLNLLAACRWVSMLAVAVMLLLAQLGPYWMPFWTYWSGIMVRIGEGCKVDVQLTTGGIRVLIAPRQPDGGAPQAVPDGTVAVPPDTHAQ